MPPATTDRRMFYLDNLRIGLIVLVVLHHVAMAYGAAGLGFYYVMRDIEMNHMLKFGIAAAIAVPLCFAVAGLVRHISGVSRVL